MRISSFLFAIFLILMLSCSSPIAQRDNSFTVNLSTTWVTNQAVFIRQNNVARIVCGFFCLESCTYTNAFLFSIYIAGTGGSDPKIVWSANRDRPVGFDAILNFTAGGDLVLKDGNGSTVWTTNTAGKSVAGMNLTDTGNLVLFDVRNSIVWQSFDHPTDCLIPGQTLFAGQKLKSSVSLTNSSEGMYSLQVTDKGMFAYVESNPHQTYFNPFDHVDYTKQGSRYIKFLDGSLSLFIDSSEASGFGAAIDISPASSAQYMKLMPNGHLNVLEWQPNYGVWTEVDDLTADVVDECSYPLVCGRYGICSSNQQCSCPEREYFRPMNERLLNLGCSEIAALTCNSTQDQDFITLENVTYFTFTADMKGVNMEACKQACQNNCSCRAVFFKYDYNVSSGECFLPSEVFTMRITDQRNFNALALMKVQNVTSRSPDQVPTNVSPTNRASNKAARFVGFMIGTFVLLLVVAIGVTTYVVHKRKRGAEMEEEYLDQVPGMPTRFSYYELTTATHSFSKKLGEGGFGSVFEGSLEDGSKIAVKCLEGLSHIKKSFLAEVQSIGSIHHVNLVRLRGFCTMKSQRFLVYDFMSNGSLDQWIYHGNREHILEWECRKKIILDIAKGLAYLHEECRQKIIHLDIKPQNILLDEEFNAKVSDFGLSKLMERNQSEVMTTMRGTPGYLAPEWLSAVITEKVDVYSFGIVLLEILCGRKNFDRSLPEESWHLLSVFQKCWEQGILLDLVDMSSEDMQTNGTEVVKMMNIASWCLQTDYTRRPPMSSVVKVLEGGMDVESDLDYNFTDPRIQRTHSHEKDLTPLLPSVLSGPR